LSDGNPNNKSIFYSCLAPDDEISHIQF